MDSDSTKNNNNQAQNTQNPSYSQNNTYSGYNGYTVTTPPMMYPPPQMYYYQPFRPQVPPGYQGYQPPMPMQMHTQMPMFYPPIPYPTANAQIQVTPMPPVPAPKASNTVNQAQVKKPSSTSISAPLSKNKANSRPNVTNASRSAPFANIPYNLDDPEELEKWKAERRKKFPSAKKESSEDSKDEKEPIKSVHDTPSVNEDVSDEEGAIVEESDMTEESSNNTGKRKRTCRFFSRGHCSKGDSCPFEHIASALKGNTNKSSNNKKKKTKVEPTRSNRSTIFENLLEIEKKDSMMKFYECIKLILMK